MLKKAGIVVAAVTAGLLAVSPLAFAGDKGGDNGNDKSHSKSHDNGDHDKRDHDRDKRDHDRDKRHHDGDRHKHHHDGDRHKHHHDGDRHDDKNINNVEGDKNKGGLINVSDNNVAVPVNVCDNNLQALNILPINDAIADVTGALSLFSVAEDNSDNIIANTCVAEANAGDQTLIKQKVND